MYGMFSMEGIPKFYIKSVIKSDIKFDIIIGNPPYNQNHLRHIPNKINPKKTDKKWVPIWHMFIEKSIELLNDYGYLLFIIPTTWLKPDKANIYQLLTKYKIHKLHTLSSYEVYKAFDKKAQIPCCYFLLQLHDPKTNLRIAALITILDIIDKLM